MFFFVLALRSSASTALNAGSGAKEGGNDSITVSFRNMTSESFEHRQAGITERFKRGSINVAKGVGVLALTALFAGAFFHALHAPGPAME